MRSLSGLDDNFDRFAVEMKRPRAAEFQNCINRCLLRTEISNHIAPAPLHVIMGLSGTLLDLLERFAEKHGLGDSLKISLCRSNVQRSKQFGGHLTGDASLRLLGSAKEIIAEVVGSMTRVPELSVAPEIRLPQTWATTAELLSDIAHLIMRARPLCTHELATLADLIARFAAHWQFALFPGQKVTPKQHLLTVHTATFAQRWKTVSFMLMLVYLCVVYVYVYVCV
jgi:hypothetical protein